MKVHLMETEWLSKDNWHKRQIFNGECEALQLRNYDRYIKQPSYIRIDSDGTLVVAYDKDSNVRVEIDENKTAWCMPAIKPNELQNLIKDNESRLEVK